MAPNARTPDAGGDLRRRVLRYARSHPHATAAQIAALVGCHPATAARHLLDACPQYSIHRTCSDQARQRRAETSRTATELALLSRSSSPDVRGYVALNLRCPPPVLQRLARDPKMSVRYGVTSHAAIPPATLAQLAVSAQAFGQRWVVARNPNCRQRLLARLASDPDPGVRFAVSKHPSTPLRVLEWLSTRSDDEAVASAAAKTLKARRGQQA